MAEITFRNGVKLVIPQQVLIALHDRAISPEGAKRWQGIRDEKDGVVYLLNMD